MNEQLGGRRRRAGRADDEAGDGAFHGTLEEGSLAHVRPYGLRRVCIILLPSHEFR